MFMRRMSRMKWAILINHGRNFSTNLPLVDVKYYRSYRNITGVAHQKLLKYLTEFI